MDKSELQLLYPKSFNNLQKKLQQNNSHETESCPGDFTNETKEYINNVLKTRPYPMLRILECLLKDEEPFPSLMKELINNFLKGETADAWTIFNFLVNMMVPEDAALEICPIMLSLQHDKKDLLTPHIYLILFSRENDYLLRKYLEFERNGGGMLSRKSVLYHAITHKQHFIEEYLEVADVKGFTDETSKNAILLSELVHKIDLEAVYSNSKFTSKLDTLESLQIEHMNYNQKIIFNDLSRVKNIINFLKDCTCAEVAFSEIVTCNGLLDMVYKYVEQPFSFQAICECMETCQKLSVSKNEDIEVFSGAFILSFIVSSLHHELNNQILRSKLDSVFRQIKSVEGIVEVVDDIFKSLLLRSSKNTSFICKESALTPILNYLKDLIVKRSHYETNKENVEKLRQRLNWINQAFWKLSLVKKYCKSSNILTEFHISNELLSLQEDVNNENSSDESASEKFKDFTSYRKRMRNKKKPKFQKSNSEETKESDIITKLLTTPRNLCLLCLNYNDLVEARNIAKEFTAECANLEKEMVFQENYCQARKKLEPIFEKYIKQESRKMESVSTIEQIEQSANIGFEASKIINIIEKYGQQNLVTHSTDDDHVIDKHKSTYPYLEQYKANALPSIVIFDLILNLANNYEISYNILSTIEKKYCQNFTTTLSSQQSKVSQNVGCIEFLRDLVECLQDWQSVTGERASMKKALNEFGYTLKPSKLKYEHLKEQIFIEIYSKSNMTQTNEELERYIKILEKANDLVPNKFNGELVYFNRFINYLNSLCKLLKMKSDKLANAKDLLSLNPREIVGELLFDDHYTPFEIEFTVDSLNLNLSHVIALNCCPESLSAAIFRTANCCNITPSESYSIEDTSIYNYVECYSPLLSYVLHAINHKSSTLYDNSDVYFQKYVFLDDTEVMGPLYSCHLRVTALLCDYLDLNRLNDLNDELIKKDISLLFNMQSCLESCIPKIIAADVFHVRLVEFLDDINLRAKLFIDCMEKVEKFEEIERLTKGILLHKNIESLNGDYKEKLETIFKKIEIFSEVAKILDTTNWYTTSDMGCKGKEITIMKQLLNLQQFEIAYKWSEAINFPHVTKAKREHLEDVFLRYLLDDRDGINKHLLTILESFQRSQVVEFYEANLSKIRKTLLLKHIIDYICQNRDEDDIDYKNYYISFKILELMEDAEREKYWELLRRPLLMIEQLIMNAKFELLVKILEHVRPLLGTTVCKTCFDKRKAICNLTITGSATLGNLGNSEFILINFILYQRDHVITNECIDSLLRIYARKSLEYNVNEAYSSTDPLSQTSVMASLDSLCETFVMPKNAPAKSDWVRDDAANYCMCCKRANFTMLTRRHHCRRCGRVVCYSCSTHRMLIPELYNEIPVRTCIDCFKQSEAVQLKDSEKARTPSTERNSPRMVDTEWQLTGNITHDKLLREEFCYEHSPSVALCLSILSFHLDDKECVRFLLDQCRKFEKLILDFPNPEIDYALVAKMLNCLALAAKFRGGPSECNMIREHSEIINSLVKNGAEAFIPNEDLNIATLRKLADSLVVAENWPLAFDISVKCGYSATGVMAAHGLSCLKAGCFETAREKFLHCMSSVSNEKDNSRVLNFITSDTHVNPPGAADIPTAKRPNRSPPLLGEIIKIIEITYRSPQPETLHRASAILSSNTSLSSIRSKRKENIQLHEPALNILNTIANLKQITIGNYLVDSNKDTDNRHFALRNSRLFEESMYYLLMYGSHVDIIGFLIHHQQLSCALKYFISQKVDNDIFIQAIFLNSIKRGKVDYLIDQMIEIDESLSIWREVIIQTCRFLETKGMLNSLYNLQVLLKDPIRASMTCVKFYSMNCSNFQHLHSNAFHLHNAQKHLLAELELCVWDDVHLHNKKDRHANEPSFVMRMDTKTINCHINTILRQLEVTKYLANCEKDGVPVMDILKKITLDLVTIPTLFDSVQSKIQVCILVLICGKNVEEGFGLAFRIIEDYKLQAFKVYGTTAKYLARHDRLREVEVLINCIRSNNGYDDVQVDDTIYLAVQSASNINLPETKTVIDNLIKIVKNPEKKISSLIHIGHLITAYLLAVQYDRVGDLRKILRQAEITNQAHVKRLCEKKLNIKH